MALAIGSLTPNAIRGTVQGEKKPVSVVTRAGVAGTGLLVGAAQATPYQLETDYYGTLAQCGTWRDSALAMVGTVVSITDAFGATWSDTAVLDIEFRFITAKGLGGSNTTILRATWTLVSEV
jgi:hypothetical protein